jgi:hypothetical protein
MTIEACALYFPLDTLPLKTVFPNGRSEGGLFRKPTWFEYDAGEGPVRLHLRHPDLAGHLQGFRGYVAQAPESGEARAESLQRIARTRAAIGVSLPHPVSIDSRTFASLMSLIARFDGFMFVFNSMLLPDGRFLVGPMAVDDGETPSEPPPLREVDPEAFRHQRATNGSDPARLAQREHHYRQLAERGFLCARWLPLHRSEDRADRLRPVEQIAARLFALNVLFLWACTSEEVATSERLHAFIARNALRDHLAPDETDVLDLPRERAQAEHAGSIGWRLENMWALSWMFGFEPEPPFFQGQLPQEVIDRMLFEFLPDLDASIAGFVADHALRPVDDIARLEDLYYCAHNAVRSAQVGGDTLPPQFHPVRDGGATHERRHALTWALSPGVDWDDTDLST